MSDLREAVARALYEHREGPVANADFSRQQALWHDCTLQAESALKAVEAAGFVVKRRDAIEESEATLEAYVSDFCEGFCAELPLDYADSVMLNDCSGCRARVALAKAAKP